MADDTAAPSPSPTPPAPRPSSPLPLIILGVVALAIGGVVGTAVLGPRIAGKPRNAAAAHPKPASDESLDEEDHGGKASGGHGGHGAAKKAMFRLDNLIVNPAGSQGMRFLMATVAFEVGDEKAEARMRDREVQIRDAVIGVLERQTLEAITRPNARDSLKVRLEAAVRPIVGKETRLRAYLPQFVVQ